MVVKAVWLRVSEERKISMRCFNEWKVGNLFYNCIMDVCLISRCLLTAVCSSVISSLRSSAFLDVVRFSVGSCSFSQFLSSLLIQRTITCHCFLLIFISVVVFYTLTWAYLLPFFCFDSMFILDLNHLILLLFVNSFCWCFYLVFFSFLRCSSGVQSCRSASKLVESRSIAFSPIMLN